MTALRFILFPISFLYGLVMSVRNLLYDIEWFKTLKNKKVYVINIGNLSVGGTGKTPHVEYLIRLLKGKKKAILSRGYGRKTRGVVIADANTNAKEIGDESAQYTSHFYPETLVAVAEKRVSGLEALLKHNKDLEIIILDDAFQHRSIHRDLNILISDFNNLFYKDYMMPTGTLREFRAGAQRAGAIIISKCPEELSLNQMEKIRLNIISYTEAPVFFSKIKYKKDISSYSGGVLVTGIANVQPLIDYFNTSDILLEQHYKYKDHYQYTQKNIDDLKRKHPEAIFFTTEKDYVKIKELNIEGMQFVEIPIEVEFFGKDFDTFVLSNIGFLEQK